MTHSRWLSMTFLLLFASLCVGVGIVLLGISIATSPSFPHLEASPYPRVQDFASGLAHVDCDVVIFGDSSTMTSLDPAIIEAQTHLKTCNISQSQPIVLVTGSLPIDLYLTKNRQPKYLVMQFAPEMFYQSHELEKTAAFDAITYMVRQHPGLDTDLELLKHPTQVLKYVSIVLQDRYFPKRRLVASFDRAYAQPIADYYSSRGLMTLPKPTETECGPPKENVASTAPTDFTWIEEALGRYSAKGIRVLVRVSPIPECDSQLKIYRENLTPRVDGGIVTLPISMFNDGDRHFAREGATFTSHAIAEQLEKLEQGNRVAISPAAR